MSDSWDLETHIREASDVVAQRLACSVTYALVVILVAGWSHVVMKLSMKARDENGSDTDGYH
jgi:hypothetical protein